MILEKKIILLAKVVVVLNRLGCTGSEVLLFVPFAINLVGNLFLMLYNRVEVTECLWDRLNRFCRFSGALIRG